MYVQPVSLEFYSPPSGERVKDSKALSLTLKELVTDMHTHDHYVTHQRGEPPVSNRVLPEACGIKPQRKRGIIHTLVHAVAFGEQPKPADQRVPSFFGFQDIIPAPTEKSKAYYFMTYPDPSKKSVLNDVMLKVTNAVKKKHMPFAVIVGDQPVYTLLVKIKNEHPQKYEKIIPFLGPFHTQLCMVYTIYKRYKGSEVAEVFVAAGVITEGSVDQALRGKHYRRALHCLMLMYETLMHLHLTRHCVWSKVEASTKEQLGILREHMKNP